MAFHQDNDIIGTIALCLDVPDMVRFSMAHRNGSLMIGLRRLFYWLKNVFGFIWWILFCSWIHFIQTILFYTFPYFSFTFICCRIIHILSWIWVCTHLFLCFCTSHTFLCVYSFSAHPAGWPLWGQHSHRQAAFQDKVISLDSRVSSSSLAHHTDWNDQHTQLCKRKKTVIV